MYYHGVAEVQREQFRQQMEWLTSKTKVVPLTEVASPSASGWRTCITFDDALDSVRGVIPILRDLGLPATLFVVSGNLGRKPQWEMPPGHADARESLMTPEQLQALPRQLIQIGSHTVSHPNLVNLPGNEVWRELYASKRDLEDLLGDGLDTLSVPFGKYNRATLQIARAVGYKHVLTCEPEVLSAGSRPFEIGRSKVTPEDWAIEFSLKTAGAYRWLRYWHWLGHTCAGILGRRAAVRFEMPERHAGEAMDLCLEKTSADTVGRHSAGR